MKFKKALVLRFMNFWPPYLGAGVKVKYISKDFRKIKVYMNSYFWNKNYVGTHFGGSLYSMVDPFFMLMILENLGKGYVVWDKAAYIRFKKPAKGKVSAEFELLDIDLENIKNEVNLNGKAEPKFLVKIYDEQMNVVTEVEKIISVKIKST